MTKLYLAYGSNLNKAQMSQRCPTAKAVGAAMIYGYELVFEALLTLQSPKTLICIFLSASGRLSQQMN